MWATSGKMVIYLTIKTQKPIKIINDCDALIDEVDVASAILWASKVPTPSIHHVYQYGNYAGVTVNGEKTHVHRLLLEWQMNQKLPRGMFVHHLNENKMDDRLSNLAIMVGKYHTSHHMAGAKFTQEHKAKLSEANHRRAGTKQKKRRNLPVTRIVEAYKNGSSVNSLAIRYHVDWTTIRARLDENPELLEARNGRNL
ncbi:HNH endonuclease [Lacticaseibacillus pantheris]|uniref:HNH endonuclease n=1 Tax=Lacticaseibacillus pantheris TaxID=171523 RepID=UPI0026580CC9|nr:HNH endonuclease [Lacticaseibacillus pantheris]WKF84476.1 HNH endonuclease [Lacticaseibacillus pantheris]